MAGPDHLNNVLSEVLTSEQSFNASMKKCRDNLFFPLIFQLAERRIIADIPDFKTLYEKFCVIIDSSDRFIARYQNSMINGDPNGYISIFRILPDVVVRYVNYIELHHKVLPLIRRERQFNKAFDNFISEIEGLLSDTFQSFLILPIQRPPRYQLLLREIIQSTPQNSQNLPFYEQIIQTIADIITAADMKIEEFEEEIQISDLQNRLNDFDTYKKGRHLYFMGDCNNFSRKKGEQRHIILFSDVLIIAEYKSSNKLRVNNITESGQYLILDVKDDSSFNNCIDIRKRDKSFRASMATPQQKTDILNAFNLMLENNNLQLKRLEMLGFAPIWIPDENAPICMLCGDPFTKLTNRKHHCRYCGYCICKKCFQNKIVCPGRGPEPQQVCKNCYEKILAMDPRMILPEISEPIFQT
ncbi:FYVE zinc finger family protein [Tritrichomonas foetus]|uniref:FYVE zinc finger family protein n=1 Tax=Tritrichomonas foetus TaxID=1144522 RepID=A0A1J4KR85_9EUKA|nr:FYVE zinc finger family protein [Tritrichomonas foetus]|eukprot:OHT11981.1 FYVE zinc finger family protein [Tritrichomonas foetus]